MVSPIILSSFRARQEMQERELAIEALKMANGYIKTAARLVGLHPSRFHDLVKRHGLQSFTNKKPFPRTGGNAAWRALADT
jgi:transcriptional regulator with GAF, ATPase, and Fis domain